MLAQIDAKTITDYSSAVGGMTVLVLIVFLVIVLFVVLKVILWLKPWVEKVFTSHLETMEAFRQYTKTSDAKLDQVLSTIKGSIILSSENVTIVQKQSDPGGR